MAQLTPTSFKQSRNESLPTIPRSGGGPQDIRITHVLHPYSGSEFNRAVQAITFETIRCAMRFAGPDVKTRCVCVTLPEDTHLIPADFLSAQPLHRTVQDTGLAESPDRLPLMFDILERGLAVEEKVEAPAGVIDYVIWTNSDIHLMPQFYLTVRQLIMAGYGVININRRTVPYCRPDPGLLPFIYGEFGFPHPGDDCFVFPRSLGTKLIRNDACVGVLNVMRGIDFNLAAMASRYLKLTHAHLTFHIGDDRRWTDRSFDRLTSTITRRRSRSSANWRAAARKRGQ